MRLWETNPLQQVFLTEGQGCTVLDTAGRSYLNLLSGTWCAALGHGHPKWIDAIEDQLSRLAHTGAAFVGDEVNHALAKLAEILPPSLNRAVLLNTGSEAVELALKMARVANGRR